MRRFVLLLLLVAVNRVRADDDARDVVSSLSGRVWHDEAPLADGSFEMTCVIDELDAKGNVTNHLVLEHRRTFRGGRMREELVSAHENGVDILEKQRKTESSHPARRGTAARWSLDDALAPPVPFLGEPPDHYRLVSEATAGMAGARRVSYAPRRDFDDRRCAIGHVELDAGDGLPRRLVFTPIPLPKMIRALTTTVRYGRLASLAVPESTESVGEGGFLFLKKRFRIRMRYHHWNLDAAGSSAHAAEPAGK